jgi:uncharacterized protein YbjT (DUF2867 family)
MRVLVTGATGKAGGATVRALRDRGADVEVVTGRLPDPGRAWDGVEAAFVLSGFADASTAVLAEKAGVRRVALLWAGYRGPVEEAFAATDIEWTLLQPASFLGNSLVWAESVRERGEVAEPFVDVRETMVHEADVGAVAATVLLEGGHAGRTYELTGREPVSVRDRVAAIAEALGRPVRLVELAEAEARRRWLAEGYDAALVDALVAWQQRPVAEATRVSPDVEQVLGRPPLTFADWLPAHLEAFR